MDAEQPSALTRRLAPDIPRPRVARPPPPRLGRQRKPVFPARSCWRRSRTRRPDW